MTKNLWRTEKERDLVNAWLAGDLSVRTVELCFYAFNTLHSINYVSSDFLSELSYDQQIQESNQECQAVIKILDSIELQLKKSARAADLLPLLKEALQQCRSIGGVLHAAEEKLRRCCCDHHAKLHYRLGIILWDYKVSLRIANSLIDEIERSVVEKDD